MLPDMSKSQVAQEGGLLTVNRKVVKAAVHRVASEVPGVIQLGGDSLLKRILRWLGFKPGPRGIELELADGEAAMTITLVVRAGARVPEIAAEVRRRVKKKLKEQLGIDVRTVNVTVASVKPTVEAGPAPFTDLDESATRGRATPRRFDLGDELPL
jgi:uncharacterized alkaline shock family protein YloU